MKISSPKHGGSMTGVDAPKASQTAKAEMEHLKANKAPEKRIHNTSSEKVVLSQKVADMHRIRELATPSHGVDEAKVARLQKLIDEGKYNVDSGAVADRLVDEHLNMPS